MFKIFLIFLIFSSLALAAPQKRIKNSHNTKLPPKKYFQEQPPQKQTRGRSPLKVYSNNSQETNPGTEPHQQDNMRGRSPVKKDNSQDHRPIKKSYRKYRSKIGGSNGIHTRTFKRRKPIDERSHFEHRLNVDWLNGVYIRTPSDSTYNPANAIFQTESYGARTDLNIDYRLSYESKYKLVIRPRVYHQYKNITIKTAPVETRTVNNTSLDLTEVFAEAWMSDSISMTVGLQNYQWGPAEFLSPSDPLYHFNSSQWSLLWRQKGQNLVRLNFTPSTQSSFVGIFEPIHNDDTAFIANRNYISKFLLKAEIRGSRDAQNYFGLTGGTEEENKTFLGAYANYKISDGWSLYTDVRSTKEPFTYSPQLDGVEYNMLQSPKGDWNQLGVLGARYEEGRWDLRMEFIYNSSGYSKNDLLNALSSIQPGNSNYEINGQRFLATGLELYGQFYSYISLRVPDIGDRRQWQFRLQYMYSGMDSSGKLGGAVEWAWTNHLVVVSEVRESIGPKDSEFLLQEKHYAFLGLKTLW